MEQTELQQAREYQVVKSNDLIQKSRFQLSMQEQKIILYLISKIKPTDMLLTEHTFEIIDFCKICGLETNSGKNYSHIKQNLKKLRDKSVWVTLKDGSETTLGWLNKITINKKSGTVIVRLDDDMKPYLLQLQNNFTSYELLYTLAMKSQYSIRLYEILKSYEYQKKDKIFDIDELKHLISAEKYNRFPDFKRYVLDISMREINELSDITITFEPIKEGKKYSKIRFSIKLKKDMKERLKTWARIEEIIDPPQITIYDLEK